MLLKRLNFMKSIYHYTKIDSLKQIVKNGDLNFRASRYTDIGNGEFEWIRSEVEIAIRQICDDVNVIYESNQLKLIPYIISFCMQPCSEYMWKNYAGYDGVQIELDESKIKNIAENKKKNPDVFMKCLYISDKEKDDLYNLIKLLDNLYGNYAPKCDDLQSDLLECAACLKQEVYRKEDEYRYMIPNYEKIVFLYSPDSDSTPYKQRTKENEENVKRESGKKYIYRAFPQETLLGVTFGPEVGDDVIKDVYHLLKDKGFDVSRISFKKLKIINTCIGPRLRRCDSSSLFK